jgi:hypothetical protein
MLGITSAEPHCTCSVIGCQCGVTALLKVARSLLEHGADIDAEDEGRIPVQVGLWWAEIVHVE